MNSELIDKAFIKSDLVSCIDYDVLNYKECLNKFAELIVNECLNNMHIVDSISFYSSTPNCIQEIKEHFGIEE